MAKALFLGGRVQLLDNNGDPLAGGYVYFYEPGTTTAKDTYSDKDLTTANTNPVVLDAYGRAAVFLNGDYKVRVYSGDPSNGGALVYEEDGINPESATVTGNYNLAVNGSFENDTNSDNLPDDITVTPYAGGTVALDATDRALGSQSLKFVSTGSGGGIAITDNFFEVTENRDISVTFQLKSSVVDVRNLFEVIWYDNGKNELSTTTIYDDSTTNPTTWSKKGKVATPPANARFAKWRFYGAHSSDTTPGTVYLDDVVITEFTHDTFYGADTGVRDAYVVDPVPGVVALKAGYTFRLSGLSDSNSGPCTVAVSGLSAVSVKLPDGSDPQATMLRRNGSHTLRYDGTNLILLDPSIPAGSVEPWFTATAKAGYLHCDGSEKSMTAYEDLYDVWGGNFGLDVGTAFTADSSTDTFTATAHGLSNGDVVEVSNSGGALPAGLTENTKYFVVGAATNTFQVSASRGGSAVTITDNGTGTHSFHSRFKLVDMRGEFLRGWDNGAGNDPDAASRTDRGDGTTGDNVGTKQADENKSHQHGSAGAHTHRTYGGAVGTTYGDINYTTETNQGTSTPSLPMPSDGAHQHPASGGNESRPRNVSCMFIVKY